MGEGVVAVGGTDTWELKEGAKNRGLSKPTWSSGEAHAQSGSIHTVSSIQEFYLCRCDSTVRREKQPSQWQ